MDKNEFISSVTRYAEAAWSIAEAAMLRHDETRVARVSPRTRGAWGMDAEDRRKAVQIKRGDADEIWSFYRNEGSVLMQRLIIWAAHANGIDLDGQVLRGRSADLAKAFNANVEPAYSSEYEHVDLTTQEPDTQRYYRYWWMQHNVALDTELLSTEALHYLWQEVIGHVRDGQVARELENSYNLLDMPASAIIDLLTRSGVPRQLASDFANVADAGMKYGI